MRTPRAMRAGFALIVVLAVTGCLRMESETNLTTDNTFSQRVVLAVSPTAAAQAQQQVGLNVAEQITAVSTGDVIQDLQSRYPGQVVISEYDDGDRQGIEVAVNELPLDEFNAVASQLGAGSGAAASIERVGDSYVVTITSTIEEALGEVEEGVPPTIGGNGAGANLAVLENAIDFAVSYRFPGLVTEATAGTVDGHTVTLSLTDLVGNEQIRVTGAADSEIYWDPIIRWGLIALAFIVIIGGAALLVRQDRRRRRPGLPPIPTREERAFPDGNEPPPMGSPAGAIVPEVSAPPPEPPTADEDEGER